MLSTSRILHRFHLIHCQSNKYNPFILVLCVMCRWWMDPSIVALSALILIYVLFASHCPSMIILLLRLKMLSMLRLKYLPYFLIKLITIMITFIMRGTLRFSKKLKHYINMNININMNISSNNRV